ncbi:MAG TPA: flagellar hook protein FlgE [Clostridia bacterium]|nr:flagellar hook protein FlgE [Clostridia bacterium]
MPVFSIPLSGLTASSTALSAIANNLANLNTVGYKQTRATFRDLFYQRIGSNGAGDPIQIGAGAAVGSLSTVFTGGNVETSGISTDVAITGDGFFVVEKDGMLQYTRAGNFSESPEGFLVTEDGAQVLGYPSINGQISTGQGLGPIQLGKGQINPPQATSTLQMKTNLDANALAGTTFSTPLTVYDSLGASHVVTFKFTKTGADALGNSAWSYEASVPSLEMKPALDASGNPIPIDPKVPKAVVSGSVSFDGFGKLVPSIDISGLPIYDDVALNISGFANGANDLNTSWKVFDNKVGLLTQVAAPSDTASTYQDGFGAGSMLDFAIGADGVVLGAFTNGTKMLGQLALATFPNVQGLTRQGHNNFASTLASGQAAIGEPGTGGRGTLAGGALELSNVDIAREFAQLIMAQRGFQANARAITTFDEITQETINLKR